MKNVMIRALGPTDVARCERIVRAFTNRFDNEQALLDQVGNLSRLETYVVEIFGCLAGFISLRVHDRFTAEIDCIAVRPQDHGQGLGRALLAHAEWTLRARTVEFVQIRVLDPTTPSEYHERARGFFEHMGFRLLELSRICGAARPWPIMAKYLADG